MSIDTTFHHGDVAADTAPIIRMEGIKKHFGNIIALNGVDFDVRPGECHCLLGDNGAGKSTFIKTMSGVHKPTDGQILFEGKPLSFSTPRDAMEAGIATVFQDLATIPLMSVTRNFFMGREPTKGRGLAKRFDIDTANQITMEEMRKMGINLRAPDQAVGTLSGGGAPDRRHRPCRVLRREGTDPRRADLGAWRAADIERAVDDRTGAQAGGRRGLHQP
jgi:simple sugar transport system ATP-binding protein